MKTWYDWEYIQYVEEASSGMFLKIVATRLAKNFNLKLSPPKNDNCHSNCIKVLLYETKEKLIYSEINYFSILRYLIDVVDLQLKLSCVKFMCVSATIFYF